MSPELLCACHGCTSLRASASLERMRVGSLPPSAPAGVCLDQYRFRMRLNRVGLRGDAVGEPCDDVLPTDQRECVGARRGAVRQGAEHARSEAETEVSFRRTRCVVGILLHQYPAWRKFTIEVRNHTSNVRLARRKSRCPARKRHRDHEKCCQQDDRFRSQGRSPDSDSTAREKRAGVLEVLENIASRVHGSFCEFFFDSQKLVVLCHAVAPRCRSRLDLPGVGGHSEIGNCRVFRFAGTM